MTACPEQFRGEHQMAASLSSSLQVSLVLVASGQNPVLAAGVLARHLGISEPEAQLRLCDSQSPLAEALDPASARRLAELLRSFGVRARLEPDVMQDGRIDVSIQLAVPVRVQRTIRQLARHTGLTEAEISERLQRPGGLMLEGLDRAEVERLKTAVMRMNSLLFLESDPAGAVYDVFLTHGDATDRLTDRLKVMGAEPDPITGAIASGLDAALCNHLKRRSDDAGLLVLDRAFQRYDLYLTRATGWVTRDLADFLVARTGHSRSRFEVLSQSLPLKIETGLTHCAARQFRADYGSIGLHTLLVLSGLERNPDNPIL